MSYWRIKPRDQSFVWALKQHLEGRWFHNNDEKKIAIRQRLPTHETDTLEELKIWISFYELYF